VRRTWAPRGQPPLLIHPFNWKKASMAAALCDGVRGGGAQLAFHVTAGNYDTDTLIEVLRGLCLLPDRYAYDYGGTIVGDPAAPLRLACQPRGPVPIPTTLPRVVWRRGIDLDPVDLHDPDAVRWLECCIWPDQPERLARLQAAVGIAQTDPPQVFRGDLLELVGPVVAHAPADVTVVVFHAAALVYLPEPGRQRFAELMAELPAVWISAEGPGVVPALAAALEPTGA
jgi:hypothetical protein